MSTTKRKPVRVLSGVEVAEISAVDHAAAPGARIVMLKRDADRAVLKAKFDEAALRLARSVQSILDDDNVTDKNAMLARTFGQCLAHLGEITGSKISLSDVSALHRIFDVPRAKNLDVSTPKAKDDEGFGEDDPDRDDESDEGGNDGESKDQLERAERALEETTTMKSHDELMSAVVKKYGITAFCKSVENGDVRVSEHRLTELISEHCARTGVSFSKLFEANTPEGVTLRKAIMAARDQQFLSRMTTTSKAEGMPGRATLQPRVTGGAAARAVDNPKSALAELQALVDEQRAQHPELSESQAWQRVYEHPDNQGLAARETGRSRRGGDDDEFRERCSRSGERPIAPTGPAAGDPCEEQQRQSLTALYTGRRQTL
jgi:hypothetical protein